MKYVIYNDSTLTFENFGISDIEYADTINPGGVATWNGDLSKFRDVGGKLLTYHGRQDGVRATVLIFALCAQI
jgi:feruloyl esterase